MRVRPFRGARPWPDLASRIPSDPYDVVDSAEARRLARGDPYTFLHVERAEVDLEPGISPYDDRVYAKAGENFRAMLDRGWLRRDDAPAFYVYRLEHERGRQTGLVGLVSVEDYLEGVIRPHEQTRPEKVSDRLRHARAIGAHAGPVLLAHRGHAGLEELAAAVVREAPAADFQAADGVRHTLWVVSDSERCRLVEDMFSQVPRAYIADGHHRAAAYTALSKERSGEKSWAFFLAAHFPARELSILEYNRLVRDLGGLGPPELLHRIGRAGFRVEPLEAPERPARPGTYSMLVAGRWYRLTALPEIVPEGDLVRRLDVSVLSERLLGPVLGIADARTDPRLDFEGGAGGLAALERKVASGGYAAAFVLHPIRVEDLMAVADEGRVLPPKSTWFEPKLRSGLVVHAPEEVRSSGESRNPHPAIRGPRPSPA